ncbi:Rpn family recombination-promoting nuclease/putative transposase [Entomohabitans teleogrylli]|uniref:Rpn family recombination-promoting nuclease/putative transposase n=1 Tax=Entomohabitans teleogrylli TaxID=1384589 RepID=UPI00073DAC56|nr:Rpn family recombination-promoting nuclease/putative transposase [Entomohabitans teleogrylli]
MKKTRSPAPHDGLFKTFLTHPATARDFLEIHLPPALQNYCDLDTLQLESGSFIEENLHNYFADVLWSVRTCGGDGYVYCLIEHQSSHDKYMAFRMMRYAIAAMQRHLEAGHNELPLVIPLLFCHGRASPWPAPLSWTALFHEPDIARQLYSGTFPIIDVGTLEDGEIMRHRRLAMLELLLKHVYQRDIAGLTEQLVTLLLAGYTTSEQLTTLLNWMLHTGNTAEPGVFLNHLAQRIPQHKEVFMTMAQKLEQKGLQRGLQEGLIQGREEGEHAAAVKIAGNMLKCGIDSATVMQLTGLSEDEVKQLHRFPC